MRRGGRADGAAIRVGSNRSRIPRRRSGADRQSGRRAECRLPSAILGLRHGFKIKRRRNHLVLWCAKSDAGKVKWSGVVCLAKGPTCKGPIKVLTAKWSGPFKCKASDKCKGTFELDTIKPGPGLKETSKYLYKQDIHICKGASCQDAYIGLDVGP